MQTVYNDFIYFPYGLPNARNSKQYIEFLATLPFEKVFYWVLFMYREGYYQSDVLMHILSQSPVALTCGDIIQREIGFPTNLVVYDAKFSNSRLRDFIVVATKTDTRENILDMCTSVLTQESQTLALNSYKNYDIISARCWLSLKNDNLFEFLIRHILKEGETEGYYRTVANTHQKNPFTKLSVRQYLIDNILKDLA